ncbi:hypothetical protein [Bacillus mycoides]|uniref:hypothetical protein n=1 Tax=Bacillus mycoides TaxID=1405 RepID=UPI001F305D1D|nr:hypothetical protein [Bacillus mycoides]
MKFDLTLSMAAMVTSIVTLVLFLLLHYVIEPCKEKKRKKSEKFKELYAPLYMMINARLTTVILHEEQKGAENLHFTNGGSEGFIDDDYMIEFVLKNSSYASVELLWELDNYNRYATDGTLTSLEYENLTKTVITEYQQIRKDLGLEYNEKELETGLPTAIRHIRAIHSIKMSNQNNKVAE